MPLRPVLALQMVLWAFGSTGSADQGGQRQGKEGRREAVPLVRPSNNHLQLEVAEEGLAALQAMDIPVAPLIVIGPYRSGKSFLLNQLLGVGCEEGFGVGHTRDTQTKGVWVWGEAVRRRAEGEGGGSEEVGLVLMDTEGLESTRRIDTYDDRIFAFSAVVSSLLVYNLAEALRESDVAKLSFASKLGKEFLGGLQPSAMLWLIQRDFLGGKTVNDMLREALAEVPNPEGNAEVTAVNDVRQSLKHLAGTSTAFGLAQPHLKRTKLCELGDSELAPEYVSQRDELRKLVHRLAAPKVINGRTMRGPQLAELVIQVVKILNTHKIPTVHNVIESYNADVASRCIEVYTKEMDALSFPLDEETLEAFHEQALGKANEKFEEDRFGKVELGEGDDSLKDKMMEGVEREHQAYLVSNRYKSTQACEQLELTCEEELEALQAMRLPSERKFERLSAGCHSSFERGCIGPSAQQYADRLSKAHTRARKQFLAGYNARMFKGLVVVSLFMIAVFRFLLPFPLLELAGWVLFLGLEGAGQLGLGGGALYETRAWRALLAVWEALVYNPLVDLERHWLLVVASLSCLWGAWMAYRTAGLRDLLTRRRLMYRRVKRAHARGGQRDLDV